MHPLWFLFCHWYFPICCHGSRVFDVKTTIALLIYGFRSAVVVIDPVFVLITENIEWSKSQAHLKWKRMWICFIPYDLAFNFITFLFRLHKHLCKHIHKYSSILVLIERLYSRDGRCALTFAPACICCLISAFLQNRWKPFVVPNYIHLSEPEHSRQFFHFDDMATVI